MSVLHSYFWSATGVIYFIAVILCIWRKSPRPKSTPPEVLEYEAWAKDQLNDLYRERAERVEWAFEPRELTGTIQPKQIPPGS